MKRLGLLLLGSLLLLALIGCTADVGLTVYEQEEYAAVMTVEMPAIGAQLQGATAQLDELLGPIRAQPGITRAEWKEATARGSGNVAYDLLVEGDNSTLGTALEGASLTPTTVDGQAALLFTYDAVPMIPYTMTLTAGEILATNGEELGGGRVRWANGGRMEATVTPRSRSALPFSFNLAWAVGGGVLVVALAGAGIYAQRQGYFGGRRSAFISDSCYNCGTYFTGPAQNFCPDCGTART